ncbi:hypothetical protein Y032_0728g1884 [Ancylostoma ceylanicum]|uniref:Reverse transcriptase domain-containing protein n=1 Tax=Ancylostoma ceylanicum TaxID=53326 RepID=A0A016WG36_9BILA|nr:hypothetical protein Y032_0728g1884 [Ancylostoma ceylanicum]
MIHTTFLARYPFGVTFFLCMDTVSKDLQSRPPWTFLYADDVVVAASTREELQKMGRPRKTGWNDIR